MQNRKPPAYQEYAATILSALPFRKMTLQERGLLYTMRLECWENRMLPNNPDELAKVLGIPINDVSESLCNVMPFFDVQNDYIFSPELEDYRIHLAEQREKQSKGGKRGAAITNSKRRTKKPNNDFTSTMQLSRQGSDESLVKSSTVKPSQPQSIKEEMVSVDDDWVNEYEETESSKKDFF